MALAAARASVNNPSGRCGANPLNAARPGLVVGDGAGRGEGVRQQPLGQVRRQPAQRPRPGLVVGDGAGHGEGVGECLAALRFGEMRRQPAQCLSPGLVVGDGAGRGEGVGECLAALRFGEMRRQPRSMPQPRDWSSVTALAAARASVNNPSGRCGATRATPQPGTGRR